MDGFVPNYPAPPIFRYREREWICYHIDMKKRLIVATMCFAVACCTATGDEPQGETWGRVFGVYSINPSKSSPMPEFPFHTQIQVTSTATSTSANPLSGGDFSALAPQDLASLPAKAFEYTCYCSEENDTKYQTFTVGNLTPGAGYHLSVYVNEPYQNNTRSQYMVVNGARLKEKDVKGGESTDDFWFKPENINLGSANKAKAPWKFVVSNVVAQSNGQISWGFPRKTNKAVMNVVTIEGTNAPAKPRLSVAKNGDASVLIKGVVGRDTLAYYFERKTGADGAWTEVGRSTDPTWTDTNIVEDAEYTYRIVASNGVATVASDEMRLFMRSPLYSLNVGAPGVVAGRFMPAETYSSSYSRYRTTTVSAGNIPADFAGSESVLSSFVYLFPSKGLLFSFSNLVANATYDLRVWTLEPYDGVAKSANPDTYRQFSIKTNGAIAVASVSPFALAGHVLYCPVPVDFKGTADADGKLVVQFNNVSDQGVVSALEVFAPAGAELTAPDVRVASTPDAVYLTVDARSAVGRCEVQYRDTDAAEPATLFSGVNGVVADISIPDGVTRQYRVRIIEDGRNGPWSDWVAAAREGRSLSEPLRVNHTYNAGYMGNPPAGWVDGFQFLTSSHDAGKLNSTAYNEQAMDFSRVSDPAPEQVYRTQFYVADNQNATFTFPGFDPAWSYKVRVHMVETWADAVAGTRRFSLAANGRLLEINNGYELDAYVTAGSNHNAAVVYEMTARPNFDGSIRLDLIHVAQNATIRGTEIIPVGAAPTVGTAGTARASWYANAEDGEAVMETCVATGDHAGLAWGASDVPAACANGRTRLLARTTMFVPWTGSYVFSAKANGRVRVWVGDATNVLNKAGCQAGTPVASAAVPLAVGCHALVFEYLQDAGADFAAELTWSGDDAEVLPALADCLKGTTESLDYGDWKFKQIGSALIPSYMVCRDAAAGAWRIAGSGYDLWGGSGDGSFLHRAVTSMGSFEVKMRVTARGGAYAPNSRLGISVRSTLGSLTASEFALYAGLNGDAVPKFKGYEDVDFVNGANWAVWGTATDLVPGTLPHWVKLARENCEGRHRYIASVSVDGETWYDAKTQDVARASTVYVGPFVTAHSDSAGRLAWIDVDHLEFVDTSARATVLFIR